jgi:asparagine synthase (glutamine-hydrolysing)
MCGINFILDRNGNLPARLIDKMNEAIRHRGPDHSGSTSMIHYDCKLFFGANRLRIVDQDPLSDQPMISDDREEVLIFSGEIYNHGEIRDRLIRLGKTFKTNSDTETLFYHLSEFGENGIKELKGMFTFLYYNLSREQLIIARDRHGMKPLYYAEIDGNLIISSETRGLISTGIVDGKLSGDRVQEYFKYGYVNQPYCIYQDIFQLKPGYSMTYDFKVGKTFFRPFDSDENSNGYTDEIPRLSDIKNLISISLKRHLSSSKPAGLMLSGGIDSSLLLAVAQEDQLPLMHTYSIVNEKTDESGGTSDYQYSRWLVKKLKWKHHHEIPIGRDLLTRFPEFISEFDVPIGDPAAILTSYLSQKAINEVGVLLSGAGADEYFAGYNRHTAFHHYLRHIRFYSGIHSFGHTIRKVFQQVKFQPLGRYSRLLEKFFNDITPSPFLTYDRFMSKGNILNLPETQVSWPEFEEEDFVLKNFELALLRDKREYLVNDILLMNDQLSLFNGIEARSPYLDDDLIDSVKSISPLLLLKHGRKWILKKLISDYGLSRIADRSKEGFGFPFGNWIRERHFKYITDNLINKENSIFGFMDYNRTINMINSHLKNKTDYSAAIFSLVVFSEWLKRA